MITIPEKINTLFEACYLITGYTRVELSDIETISKGNHIDLVIARDCLCYIMSRKCIFSHEIIGEALNIKERTISNRICVFNTKQKEDLAGKIYSKYKYILSGRFMSDYIATV